MSEFSRRIAGMIKPASRSRPNSGPAGPFRSLTPVIKEENDQHQAHILHPADLSPASTASPATGRERPARKLGRLAAGARTGPKAGRRVLPWTYRRDPAAASCGEPVGILARTTARYATDKISQPSILAMRQAVFPQHGLLPRPSPLPAGRPLSSSGPTPPRRRAAGLMSF